MNEPLFGEGSIGGIISNPVMVKVRRTYFNDRRAKMIGMDFISFLILLIIGVVVSGVLHFVFKFYIIPG
jgi:hypothetical protein